MSVELEWRMQEVRMCDWDLKAFEGPTVWGFERAWRGLAEPSFSMRSSKSSGPPQLSTRFVSQTFQAIYEPSNKSLNDNSKQNQICQIRMLKEMKKLKMFRLLRFIDVRRMPSQLETSRKAQEHR